jgi:hypothetical protein
VFEGIAVSGLAAAGAFGECQRILSG